MNNTAIADTIITITDKLSLIVLTASIWSGRKKLQADDLGLKNGEIPSEDLVSLGSKRICNPEALRVFHMLKGQAERACLKLGTRFLGGFLVPNETLDALCVTLDGLKEAFARETKEFISGYDQDINNWIASHPTWERQLRAAIDPAEVVAKKFSFRYRPLVIQPSPGQRPALAEDVAEIGSTLFHEVAQMAITLEKSLIGKSSMTQRALGTFRRIQQKLGVLSFLDQRIPPILDQVDSFLRRAPKSGMITGQLFHEGFSLWLLLCDGQRLARHGAVILAGETEVADSTANSEVEVEHESLPWLRNEPTYSAEHEFFF